MRINEKGAIELALVSVLIVLLAAGVFTVWRINQADETVSDVAVNIENQSNAPSSSTEKAKIGDQVGSELSEITPEMQKDIYDEVVSSLSLEVNDSFYFAIHDTDKVQYGYAGSGGSFAYNNGSGWKAINFGQASLECSALQDVPEEYRPSCVDGEGNVIGGIDYTEGYPRSKNYNAYIDYRQAIVN